MEANNTIIVGVDYSQPSINALKEAARQANALDCRLVCVHVIDKKVVDFWHQERNYDDKAILDHELTGMENLVRRTLGDAHNLRVEVFLGSPYAELLKVIEEEKPQLVVLGANGCDATHVGRIGIVASRVVKCAPCDVMLIKTEHDLPFNSIMVCVDFSENSLKAAREACQMAQIDKATVHLVHVYQHNPFSEGHLGDCQFPITSEKELIRDYNTRLGKLSYSLITEFPEVNISYTLNSYLSVNHGLLAEMDDVNADLVLIGASGKSRLMEILLGTTTERLLHDSSSSICVVKPGPEEPSE